MSYHVEREIVDEKKVYKELCDRMGGVDHVYVLKPYKREHLKAVTQPRISPIKRFKTNMHRSFIDWRHNNRKTYAVLYFFAHILIIVIGAHLVALIFLFPMIVKQCLERLF